MAPSYLDYAGRGLNDWWRYPVATLAALAAVTVAMVLCAIVLVILIIAKVLPADIAERMQTAENPAVFFAATGASFAVVLGGFAGGIALLHHKHPRDIIGAWTWRSFGLGMAVWFVPLIVLCLIDFAIAPDGFRVAAGPQTAAFVVYAVLALAVQTFAEEFIFRGYLTQGFLLATQNPLIAALLSGCLFGLIHIPNGVPQAVFSTVFGVALSLVAIRLGGIAFTFGLHFINNLFGAAVVVSGSDVFKGSPGLFVQNTPQLMWFDVAAGGLAVVLVTIMVLRLVKPPAAASPV